MSDPTPTARPIRAARTSDLPLLSPIEAEAEQRFREHGIALPESALTPLRDWEHAQAEDRLLVAVDADDRPVGFALLAIVDGTAFVEETDVRPDQQGRGFGTALLAGVHRWARARGLPAVTLTTFRDVPWNGPFYRRRGFVELPPEALGPGIAAIRAGEIAGGIEVVPRCAMRSEVV
jgi:GNAT superfamily N-acetyltransferase